MATYSELACNFPCPNCAADIEGPVRFQWGRIPATWQHYQIGDRIKWYRRKSGALVEPFTLSMKRGVWNCGSPEIENLYVFDCELFGQDAQPPCPGCGTVLGGVIVDIRGGVIKAVRALLVNEVRAMLGDFVETADIVVIEDDGTLTVRDDWFNPPLTVVD